MKWVRKQYGNPYSHAFFHNFLNVIVKKIASPLRKIKNLNRTCYQLKSKPRQDSKGFLIH